MEDKLKILQVYPDYLLASFDKQFLEDAGVFCVLQDEHTITMNWFYSNALGGIKLKVMESEYLKAMDLLEEKRKNENIEDFELDEDIEMELDPENEICPNCGSRNTKKIVFHKKPTLISTIFFGFPFFIRSNKTHCFNCSKDFVSKHQS